MSKKKHNKRTRRTDGGFVNKYGVFFTNEQKKALERATAKSNRLRKKELNEWEFEHNDKSRDHSQLKLMGSTPDHIVSKQSAALQRFKSMKDYNKYMRKQERIHSGEYQIDRIRLYKRNFIESLKETYNGEYLDDIIHKIHWMPPREYMKMVTDNEVLSISFVPSDQKVSGRLNQIREGLGLDLSDDWPDEEI